MADWYFVHNGEQRGPLKELDIKNLIESRVITANTKVWRAGMADWQPISLTDYPYKQLLNAPTPPPTPFNNPFPPPPQQPFPPQQAYQQPPYQQVAGNYPAATAYWYENAGIAQILKILLFVNIGAVVIQIMLLMDGLSNGGQRLQNSVFSEGHAQAFGILQGLLALATVVFWLVWKYRATYNLYSLGSGALSITPGWAVGWYFIPFANFVMPYLAMSQLWRATHHGPQWRTAPAPAKIILWWLLYMGASLIAFAFAFAVAFSAGEGAPSEAAVRTLAQALIITNVAVAVSTYFAISIIGGIADTQAAQRRPQA